MNNNLNTQAVEFKASSKDVAKKIAHLLSDNFDSRNIIKDQPNLYPTSSSILTVSKEELLSYNIVKILYTERRFEQIGNILIHK